MTETITQPRTLLEVMELVSKLRSQKAVYQTAIAYMRTFYRDSDAGKAELRITRDDLAVVPQGHLDSTLGEMMDRVEQIDVELELLQNQPIGGAPPAATQPTAGSTAEDAAIAGAARATAATKTKGTPSGKPRAQGSGAS